MTHWRASQMPPIQAEQSQDLSRFIRVMVGLLAIIGAIGLAFAALAANI